VQHSVVFALFAVLSACAQTKESHVINQPLAIHAKCRGSDKCVFDGEDLFIDIAIVNQGPAPVGFPLAYRQKTGPSIRLVDMRTKEESSLRTNPVDPALANEFTQIEPGHSATLEWVIKRSEIQRFARPEIDLSAEISVGCKIRVNGKVEDFLGSAILRIVGRGTP
jgi:hypothetical protein